MKHGAGQKVALHGLLIGRISAFLVQVPGGGSMDTETKVPSVENSKLTSK